MNRDSVTISSFRARLAVVAVVGMFIIFGSLHLRSRGFTENMEQMNIATALELRWGGNWWVPTLQDRPRLAKPPLMHWLTAWAIRPEAVRRASDPDPVIRLRAQQDIALQARSVSVISAVILLLAVYGLGCVVGDRALGVLAAAVCASSILTQRYAFWSNYDVPLAALVALTNLFLALWQLRGKQWLGATGAGVCLGLALMTKGPVALTQTLAPSLAYALWRWSCNRRGALLEQTPRDATPARGVIGPSLLLVLMMLLVGLPWFIYVVRNVPNVMHLWADEIACYNPDGVYSGRWSTYALLILLLELPWTPLFVGGVCMAIADILKGWTHRKYVLAFFQVIVPMVLMSFAHDRKGHYLLPLTASAAVLVAQPLWEHLRNYPNWTGLERFIIILQWLALVATAVLEPYSAAHNWRQPGLLLFVAVGMIAVLVGLAMHPRWRAAIVASALLVGLWGRYGEDALAGSDRTAPKILAEVCEPVCTQAPGVPVWITHSSGRASDAAKIGACAQIYLNRVVRWSESPFTQLPSGTHPAVVMMIQPASAQPFDAPDGWTLLSREHDKQYWLSAYESAR